MNNKHFIIVHNIIAPYRIYLFNMLQQCGLDFEVYFMRENEKGRSWKIDRNTQKYSYHIFGGIYWVIGRLSIYFNPHLIVSILKNRKADLILGASWTNLNVFLILVLKRLQIIPNRIHFWSEANYMTLGGKQHNKLKHWARKFIYNSGDGNFIVPGQTAEKTLLLWGANKRRFVYLPNVVQEDRISSCSDVFADNTTLPFFVIPARLIENIKGQLNFFQAIGNENIRRAKFILLGDGKDEEEIHKFIQDNHLEEHIILQGFCGFDETVSFYRRADIFCLPSFSDPCPLTIYEAMACSLPLFVSNQCGNAIETVETLKNGIVFNPYDKEMVHAAFEELLDHRAEWPDWGKRSKAKFDRSFAAESVCHNFVTQMLAN